MNRIEFFLYRLKLIRPSQSTLFDEGLSRSELLKQALQSRPTIELAGSQRWHIGNVTFLDATGGYFAVGRTTKSILEKFDEDSGNFIEEHLETSPYTHALFDHSIGFLAIAKKTRLSPNVNGIARRTEKLLGEYRRIAQAGVTVSIDSIADPHNFIEALDSAYRITRFDMTFSRPNPLDVDAMYRKCGEELLEEVAAESGKTSIAGKSLNATTLIKITHSVAATGNSASARIQAEQNSGLVKKSLKDNHASFELSEDDFDSSAALAEARRRYSDVRGAAR